ncbi:2-aminoethylphosphonate--pyruvate transaminase [Burkholderia cenocepacia]|uniref:2-aminoethylphosphonate--pyruvate transaminase n=1 Tax=Burkholderia cenocepacia TaxID=95486 RepID=UPI001902D026|nr:2-aminoethylphosphonate--pyruvate transaminase [Burkholderia cenocepacia]MBJ9668219.1 2-aminoethylphosphonate--pyruvate transaminase [Burkholderia cenocepacia]
MPAPILLTPGPLTTSATTRHAMQHDWGSWDAAFNQLTASVCADLVAIAHGGDEYVCVPMQGSGTFSVEAALGTLVPRDGVVLVPDNGAYCARILKILGRLGIDAIALPFGEDAAACRRHGKRLIVDAMSSFGALPIALADSGIDALISASGKCLEGVPGMGFAIVRRDALDASEGNSPSLALDLHDQYAYLRKTGQWRFTPPTHVIAALRAALDQYLAEGGQPARGARYADNCRTLVESMRALGFVPFLDASVQAPVIVTFHAPDHPAYDFRRFYDAVRGAGFILYPGKLTRLETFRVGCIGAIDAGDIRRAVAAIGAAVESLGIAMQPA